MIQFPWSSLSRTLYLCSTTSQHNQTPKKKRGKKLSPPGFEPATVRKEPKIMFTCPWWKRRFTWYYVRKHGNKVYYLYLWNILDRFDPHSLYVISSNEDAIQGKRWKSKRKHQITIIYSWRFHLSINLLDCQGQQPNLQRIWNETTPCLPKYKQWFRFQKKIQVQEQQNPKSQNPKVTHIEFPVIFWEPLKLGHFKCHDYERSWRDESKLFPVKFLYL